MNIDTEKIRIRLEDIVGTWDVDSLRDLLAEVDVSQVFESTACAGSIVELIIEKIGDYRYYPELMAEPKMLREFLLTLIENGLDKQDVQRLIYFYFGEFAAHYSCGDIQESIDISLLDSMHQIFNGEITFTKAVFEFVLLKDHFSKPCYEYLDRLIEESVELDDDEYSIMELSGQCEIQMVEYLVSKGGDINLAIEGGADPFMALKAGIPVRLEPNKIGVDKLSQITRFIFNREEQIKISELDLFKESGADFNKMDDEGNTPLSMFMVYAADELYINEVRRILEYLVENGADINGLSGGDGHSALMDVIDDPLWDIEEDAEKLKKSVEILVSMGASISRKNDIGETAFHLAIEYDPDLLDIIRPYLDRKPTNLVEAILFDGSESVIRLLSSKRYWSEKQITKTLEYALRLREDTTIREILKHGPDVVTALNALLQSRFRSQVSIELVKTIELSFKFEFLRYVARFNCRQLRPFWERIIAIDERKCAIDLAEAKLTELAGSKATAKVVEKAMRKKAKNLAYYKSVTKILESRVKQLFESLKRDGIFAVNIWGEGWAPGDQGWEKVFGMLTSDWLEAHNIADEIDLTYCYTDLRYYNELARHNGRGPLRCTIDNATIYYGGPTKEAIEHVAKTVVRNARKIGLVPKWNGDIHTAIELSLADVE